MLLQTSFLYKKNLYLASHWSCYQEKTENTDYLNNLNKLNKLKFWLCKIKANNSAINLGFKLQLHWVTS